MKDEIRETRAQVGPYKDLAIAVMAQAADDYRHAFKMVRKMIANLVFELAKVKSLELFLDSKNAAMYCGGVQEAVRDKLIKERRDLLHQNRNELMQLLYMILDPIEARYTQRTFTAQDVMDTASVDCVFIHEANGKTNTYTEDELPEKLYSHKVQELNLVAEDGILEVVIE